MKQNYFKEFYFNMEPRLKSNEIILAAKIILFSFQTWFHVKIKHYNSLK